ncbi:hypothetical protein MNV49_000710 [Pseudohyphozyma bogoriensis]|nr:hypothetical protein MNV49_000710 [Pseudohyphozyma bogoriensis]
MTSSDPSTSLTLTVEFGGGMELLFSGIPCHTITIPRFHDPSTLSPLSSSTPPPKAPEPSEGRPADIRYLIWWLREYLLTDKGRPELFVQGDSIRPGILILINSCDWELEGELEYEVKDGDEIVFISTLHGG